MPTDFRKSNHSGTGEHCVKVADLSCGTAARNSKHATAGHPPFVAPEWTVFLTSAWTSLH
ncbi:DUF397 domain-containing protein [Nocardiopsis flavescens]|uniref:DUF397 domain-containing protein n=1 Tax=Nocardiopsis flavescens TaxID=758803 RepID=UPI00365BDCD2